jgi:hypothetical protein
MILRITLMLMMLIAQSAWATVNEVVARNDYIGNGSTTAFAYTFKINTKTEIEVLSDGVTKTVDTDYSVAGLGVSGGGTITFVVVPATGVKVTLLRKQAQTQASTYIPNEAFPATRIERDLDKLQMQVQQLQEQLNRAIRAKKEDNLDMTLPTVIVRKSKYLGFDSDGKPSAVTAVTSVSDLVSASNCTTIANPVANVSRCFDTTRGVLMVYDGIGWQSDVALATKIVNLLDPRWGVTCDNSTDNSTGMDNAAAAAAGGILLLPYTVSTCNFATTFKPRPQTQVLGAGPKSGARGIAPTNGLKYTGTGAAVQFDGATYGANQPWFSSLKDMSVFCSAACTAVVQTSGGARNITLEHNLVWGNVNTGATTALLYFTGNGTLNGAPQGIRVLRNFLDQGKMWSILFDQGGTINEVAENEISGPFGGVLNISSTTVNMLGFTWRDNAISAPQQTGPTISVTSIAGGKFSGGYMECGPIGATRCFSFPGGGLGSVGVEIGGGMFIQPDTVSLAIVEGAQISTAFRFGPVNVTAAVTNCVLATAAGNIAKFEIMGHSNCTNTFRDGVAGVQYTGPVVMDGYTNLQALIVNLSGIQVGAPTGGDKGVGTINAAGAYYANGTIGTSLTYTMCKTGACATTCTIVTTNGLVTGGTCNP